jgi:hypothetical protein
MVHVQSDVGIQFFLNPRFSRHFVLHVIRELLETRLQLAMGSQQRGQERHLTKCELLYQKTW